MKLNVQGDINGLEAGLKIIADTKQVRLDRDGVRLEINRHTHHNLIVSFDGQTGRIDCGRKTDFFRAFGLFVEQYRAGKASFHICEEPQFSLNCVMVDVSRNAVLTTDSIKRMIRMMALMGLNALMLYMEDTYTVENRPYFGYMRGRYSPSELRECDDYADQFGIEMIPCIQTLGHLRQVLKWHHSRPMMDTEEVLLVGEPQTYRLIEDMIRSLSATFRSRRIHIGMDEAFDLGLGRYLDLNGYRSKLDLMNEHLKKVLKRCAVSWPTKARWASI